MKPKDTAVQFYWTLASATFAGITGLTAMYSTAQKHYGLVIFWGLISILCAIRSTIVVSQLKD